jgi:hypothetical protein
MTDGNLELVQVIVSWIVTLPAVVVVIRADERRLDADALARAWPPQSRDAAIFGLWNLGVHPLCVLIHFARTRRSILLGTGLGLAWVLAILLADAGVQTGVAFAIERLGL